MLTKLKTYKIEIQKSKTQANQKMMISTANSKKRDLTVIVKLLLAVVVISLSATTSKTAVVTASIVLGDACISHEGCNGIDEYCSNDGICETFKTRYEVCDSDYACQGSLVCNLNTNTCDSRGYGGGFMHNCNEDDHCTDPSWMICSAGACRRPYGKGCRLQTSYGCDRENSHTCVPTADESGWFCQPSSTTPGYDTICMHDSDCNNGRSCSTPSTIDPTNYMVCGPPCPSGTFGYGCAYTQMKVVVEKIDFKGHCSDWNQCDWALELQIEWADGTTSTKHWGRKINTDNRYFGGPFTFYHDSNLDEEEPVGINVQIWELDSCDGWDYGASSTCGASLHEGEATSFNSHCGFTSVGGTLKFNAEVILV